jgi:hypothetical protein
MKAYLGVEYLHAFLTSALDGIVVSFMRQPPDVVVKRKIHSPCRDSTPDRPARSAILYHSYPCSCSYIVGKFKHHGIIFLSRDGRSEM